MPERSPSLRLLDMVEAAERIDSVIARLTPAAFEADWQAQWLVQRGIEIISEASRHLPVEMKQRHPTIPWRKVADIGNVLRHGYEQVAAPLLWTLVTRDLPALVQACRAEQSLLSR